ncbi:tyrosyl-tRNA synthetase [Coemansia sp. BCRC 34962]|nr:tyrosyl-tRNA synthetase [Coemansia sp. BCRC 34962]
MNPLRRLAIRCGRPGAVGGFCQRRPVHSNVVETLRERNFIHSVTNDAAAYKLEKPTPAYCGVDPTADSLHLGNMVTLMGLLHFHLAGHQVLPLVGNATGMIGDPSGKSSERVALGQSTLAKNVAGIEAQLDRFFRRGTRYAAQRMPDLDHRGLKPVRILHNADWYQDMNILAFLGHIGRYARVGTMMARDSVKSRLQSSQGISFTEFSYQLLQAYDFWYLYHHHGCCVQLGGSDQWGNITAGTDLISRMPFSETKNETGETSVLYENLDTSSKGGESGPLGITISLLTTASGEKFGKSAGNAIWLDENRTSAFDVYQFFVKTADADVEKLLKMFTLLPLPRIEQVMLTHREAPERFVAQKLLAAEVTELIHGIPGLQKALCSTAVLFGDQLSSIQQFSEQDFVDTFAHDQRMVSVPASDIEGKSVSDIAVLLGSCQSKSAAARLMSAGGLYWNNKPVVDKMWKPLVGTDDFLGQGTIGILRTGKTSHRILRVISNN